MATQKKFEIFLGFHNGDTSKPVWMCREVATKKTWWAKTPEDALRRALVGEES